MDYEKTYEDALKRAKKVLLDCTPEERKVVEYIFPNLAESEDEKIRKWLIRLINTAGYRELESDKMPCSRTNVIAWLEKQGEQKPADKVEPKFKVGDWVVVDGVTQQVIQIRPDSFDTDRPWDGKLTFKDVHLWTIQDAKDGDVLSDGKPFLFKKIDANKYSYAYCGISGYNNFKIESDGESGEWTWAQDIKPATKEQRDLLFKKMHEAGYEWDAEKKELMKIEQKPWSEDDQSSYNEICSLIYDNYGVEDASRLLTWFDELKDRVQPKQKQEWSEEDENTRNHLLGFLNGFSYSETAKHEMWDWLKHLHAKPRWKPSDEQMELIKDIVFKDRQKITIKELAIFNSIYNDLMKL